MVGLSARQLKAWTAQNRGIAAAATAQGAWPNEQIGARQAPGETEIQFLQRTSCRVLRKVLTADERRS
jgi:hypothetical protein